MVENGNIQTLKQFLKQKELEKGVGYVSLNKLHYIKMYYDLLNKKPIKKMTRKDYLSLAIFFVVVFSILFTIYCFTPNYVWGTFFRVR